MSKTGCPISSKAFRTKRDASVGGYPAWGVFTNRADSHQKSLNAVQPLSPLFSFTSNTHRFRVDVDLHVIGLRCP